jgi:tetratricopeptide (TPR) repeat protein
MKTLFSFTVVIGLFTLVLQGCQTTLPLAEVDDPTTLFVDHAFRGPVQTPETMSEIFSLPENIKHDLKRVISGHNAAERKAKAVLEFMLAYADDGLLYDNASTKTAAETLAYGRANCLSLSILTYSMATELGMDAVFQDVQIPEYWTSEANQTWLNRHVNVRLRQKNLADNGLGFSLLGSDVIVDFDPYTSKKRFPAYQISAQRVVAMYHNNKAASAFGDGHYAQAYRYYKAAAQIDPDFAVTWSNLAILYRVHGLYDMAERSYNYSLRLDPSSTNTLSNLAFLYRKTGNIKQAQQLEARVIAKRRSNPYYYLMLGNEAFKRADWSEAVAEFRRSLNLDAQIHEAYFGLAKTYYELDNTLQASHYMEKALRTATTTQDQQRYEHKLAILNQVAAAH